MRSISILIVFSFFSMLLKGQNINYQYDDTGNRIQRTGNGGGNVARQIVPPKDLQLQLEKVQQERIKVNPNWHKEVLFSIDTSFAQTFKTKDEKLAEEIERRYQYLGKHRIELMTHPETGFAQVIIPQGLLSQNIDMRIQLQTSKKEIIFENILETKITSFEVGKMKTGIYNLIIYANLEQIKWLVKVEIN